MKTQFQLTKELYLIDPVAAYQMYISDPTGINASFESFCSGMNTILKPQVKNLLETLPENFEKIVDDFKVTEVFIDEYNEVHITSEYELHQSWYEAIINFVLSTPSMKVVS